MSSIPISNLNLATNNKWIASIPFDKINENYKTYSLPLTNFSLPEVDISFETLYHFGSPLDISTGVRTQDKTISFEYLITGDWINYILLFEWVNKISNELGSGELEEPINWKINIRVLMLNEFKKPIFEIIFYDCWINNFGAVDQDYQSGEEVIKHSFTCKYSYYEHNINII